MFLNKTGSKVRNAQQDDVLLDQVEELDFDPLSYNQAILGIQDKSCSSRKVNKKIGPTPQQDARNLHFKKKRREQVIKSRKASKIYHDFTRWK